MRRAISFGLGVLLVGCGLGLDLDPPDPDSSSFVGMDGSAGDGGAGATDGGDGGAGDGGAGDGDAGDGGTGGGDAGPPLCEIACDDGDDCTVDRCVVDACVFETAPDDTACRSLSDPCMAGACVDGACVVEGPVECTSDRMCDADTGDCRCRFGLDCGDRCVVGGECCDSSDCPLTEPFCRAATCHACDADQIECDGTPARCIDASGSPCCDNSFCGNQICVTGQCERCAGGGSRCGDICVPRLTECSDPGELARCGEGGCGEALCLSDCGRGACSLAAISECFDGATRCNGGTSQCETCVGCNWSATAGSFCDGDADCLP